MDRQHIFYFIGELLLPSFGLKKREELSKTLSSQGFNWQLFIAMCSNHLVLQTIYRRLFEKDLLEYLPFEIHQHLKKVYELNCRRNNKIMQQVASVNSLLKTKNIIPLYMKGVGNILDGLYQDNGERLMHDIDILIPEEQWGTASQTLLQDGYHEWAGYKPDDLKMHKHSPPLYKPGRQAVIELHRFPAEYRYNRIIGPEEVWDARKTIPGADGCFVMCDRHKIIHNFIHSQFVHHGHAYARVYMRNLFDLYLLSGRVDADDAFSGVRNYRRQVSGYLGVMEKVFGRKISSGDIFSKPNHFYMFRHEINLRSGLMSLFTFYIAILFRSYLIIPLRSLRNKELRSSLSKKMFSRNWYRRHYRSLTRIHKTKVA